MGEYLVDVLRWIWDIISNALRWIWDIISSEYTNSPLDFVGFVTTFVLTAVATWIAIQQYIEQKHEEKVENLKKIVKSIRSEQYYYADESLKYYEKRYEQVDKLLYKDGWLQKSDDNDFLPLDKIGLRFAQPNKQDGKAQMAKWNSKKNPKARFLPIPRDGYAENAKFYCDVNLTNLPLYGLSRVDGNGGRKKIELGIVRGYYYDFYDTCEVLSAEMAYRHRIKKRVGRNKLKLRDKCENVFDLTNRFVGIGINVLTIVKDVRSENGEKKNYFLLHKRSDKNVAEGANSYHVVPAGSYQPTTVVWNDNNEDAPDSLADTVVREFYEELIGFEEFSELFNSTMLAEAQWEWDELCFIGVGLNPLNTKAEILAYLSISADKLCKLCKKHSGDNTEKKSGKAKKKSQKEKIESLLKSSYEGEVHLKELNIAMLEQYRDNPKSTPAFRQILKVVLEHGDHFGVHE